MADYYCDGYYILCNRNISDYEMGSNIMSLVRWFRYFMWKYFKKDPRIRTVDDFRFWDNKLFKEHEGETQDENDQYLH